MTDIADLVPALKREIAVPGTFATTYPNTTDADLVGTLMDGFAQAQLSGFFGTQVLDVDAETVTPDLSPAGQSLVVIFAAERIVTSQILTMRTRVLYESAGSKYEVENAASVLTAILKALADRKAAILANILGLQRASTSVVVTDRYSDVMTGQEGVYIGVGVSAFYGYELVGG